MATVARQERESAMHKSITVERVMALVEEAMTGMEDNGICVCCGADAFGVEMDAYNYECEECGENGVLGGEGLLYAVG